MLRSHGGTICLIFILCVCFFRMADPIAVCIALPWFYFAVKLLCSRFRCPKFEYFLPTGVASSVQVQSETKFYIMRVLSGSSGPDTELFAGRNYRDIRYPTIQSSGCSIRLHRTHVTNIFLFSFVRKTGGCSQQAAKI